jgi:hypothetical protein
LRRHGFHVSRKRVARIMRTKPRSTGEALLNVVVDPRKMPPGLGR